LKEHYSPETVANEYDTLYQKLVRFDG